MYNHNYLHSEKKQDVVESRLVGHPNFLSVIRAVAEIQVVGQEQ